jgi:hypothetical protein
MVESHDADAGTGDGDLGRAAVPYLRVRRQLAPTTGLLPDVPLDRLGARGQPPPAPDACAGLDRGGAAVTALFDRKHRKAAKAAAADAVEAISPYADSLAHDPKLRKRLLQAGVAAAAARARIRRETGLSGLAVRLALDPVLRAQLVEVAAQLRGARDRVEHRRSRQRRVFLVAGAAAVVLVAVPAIRSIRGNDTTP